MTEIVAEISGNHAGNIRFAVDLIHEAKNAGADAVKFQCFQPERVVERRKDNPYIAELLKAYNEPYLDLVSRVYTPWEWFPRLIKTCNDLDIAWFSSVFDPLDVAYLEKLNCPRYKISAFEMLDWDIIKAVRETGKPIVMSVRPAHGVTILLATDYSGKMIPFGLSSHDTKFTEEDGPSFLPSHGCPMVEYHLKLPGVETPDSEFSLTPDQLKQVVGWIK
jgi:sialic acid synthase SpsE